MKKEFRHILFSVGLLFGIIAISAYAQSESDAPETRPADRKPPVSTEDDGKPLHYPIKSHENVTYDDLKKKSPMDLKDPDNMTTDVEYDPNSGFYIYRTKVGDMEIATPFVLSEDEYRKHALQESMNSYWAEKAKSNTDDGNKFTASEIKIGIGKTGDKIFGPGGVQLKTQGSVDLDFGFSISKRDNPAISERNRRNGSFDFDSKIQLSANGSVGEKVNFTLNYNTEATFNADQKLINLNYKGNEDDIIQRVEAGNVKLPLSSSLISGSTDLFGFRTDLQFGKLKIAAVISQQESDRKTISTQGAQTTDFELRATEYEENRHFFLSTYFYDHYDEWAKNAPNPQSGIVINKVEIWTTNTKSSSINSTRRNIIAVRDLAESYDSEGKSMEWPNNSNGNVYRELSTTPEVRDISTVSSTMESKTIDGEQMSSTWNYEILNDAKLLKESDYTINPELGYISLKSNVSSDNIVAVAYEYTQGGKVYRVGELTTNTTDTASTSTKNLIVKLIKGSFPSPQNKKLWNLAMKNVYSLGAYNIQEENFKVEIKYYYQSDSTTQYLTYLPPLGNKNLLRVLNMDRLNKRLNAMPDGYFDFIRGYTVEPNTGRIIFLSTRPFDKGIKDGYSNRAGVEKFTYPELYDSTLTKAKEFTEKDKYIIKGKYSSSSGSEIRLGATNVARGSVRVTAGGRTLVEGTGYTVDYNLGIVKILDEIALSSNSPINVSLESESFFNTQRKSLMGTNMEYAFSDKFSLGGTLLHLSEKPLTQKVGIGNEPISNTIWGMNGTFKSDWQWLTKVIDKIPFINAKAPSSIAFSGEFAQLIPGHNKAVDLEDAGTSYIDDFEGTESSINIKNPTAWTLSSAPKVTSGPLASKHFIRENDRFWGEQLDSPYKVNNIGYGLNRSHLAWYYIDQVFTGSSSNTPSHIKNEDKAQLSDHFIRQVEEREIYPDKDQKMGETTTLQTLHLHYYPKERGQYNLDVEGMGRDGYLTNPGDRWAGIMRKLDNTNFENSNVEYIEFWLMDPYANDTSTKINTTPGKLVFNLGNVSEDILKDGRKSFENGLPTSNNGAAVDTTVWGIVPRLSALTNSFDNANLAQQDLGMNGLSSEDETRFETYELYQRNVLAKVDAATKQRWDASTFSPLNDPAGDDYHYYRGTDYDDRRASIYDRYKYYNGMEGNSTASEDRFTSSATTSPDVEDINGDNTLNESEQYYEYIVDINKDIFDNSDLWESNYITNMVRTKVKLKNKDEAYIKWYQFRIPIKTTKRRAEGGITDFRSIRFIRMYMTGFEEEEHLRFGELKLVKTDWRIYEMNNLLVSNDVNAKLQGTGRIDISSVCTENDKSKSPIGYCMPPGIDPSYDPSQTQLTAENEQSMVLRIDSLEPNDARAVYKKINLDTRQYKRFKMFVHAEELSEAIRDNRLQIFVRFGSDFTENYYEYKIPLKITDPNSVRTGKAQTDRDKEIVWPVENNFDFEFNQLTELKLERDKRKVAGKVKYNEPFSMMDGHNTMTVVGSPSFGDITSMMIGIVNEDNVMHNAEIWVNEMRMSGFEEEGGWAAVANLGIVFSDLGSFTIGGQVETIGFGNIEDNVLDRNQENFYEYNISASVQLGKLFPEKGKVNMPFTYTRTHQRTSPKYDPMNTDVKLSRTLDNYDSDAIRDSIKQMSQTNKIYKSYALNNVRVGITSKKPMPYDPANFSFSLGYNKSEEVNPEVEYEVIQNYKGTFNYVYSINPKPVEPFKKAKGKALKSPHLKLIRDFNFYYVPRNIAFGTSMIRYYEEAQMRNYNEAIVKDTTFQYMSYDKNWQWDRTSDIKWDLTRNLKLSFNTATNSEIAEIIRTDEEDGDRLINIPINKQYLEDINYFDWYDKWKDTVWRSIKHFGEPVSYEQRFNISYNIPVNKLPHLDWITSNAQYTAFYQWDKGTVLALGEEPVTGNLIENQRNWNGDLRFNFETFYNKFPRLKEINRKYSKMPTTTKKEDDKKEAKDAKENKVKDPKTEKPKTFERKNMKLKAGSKTRLSHRLNAMKVNVTVKDTAGKIVPVKVSVVDANTITLATRTDMDHLTVTVVAKPESAASKFAEYTARFLMMVRNVSFNYRHGDVLEINGYKPTSGFLGQDCDDPGYDFTFGFFNADNFIHRSYAEDSVLLVNEGITTPIVRSINQNLTAKALIEPIPGLKIDLNASWMKNNRDDIYYMYGYTDDWNMKEFSGTFSRTSLPIRTSFIKNAANSELFSTFLDNRKKIQNRIYGEVGSMNSNGKPNYVNPSGADVLIPAFYATYFKKKSNEVDLNYVPSGSFKSMITSLIPNWKVSCDALMRIGAIRKKFKSFNINHAYKSTYNVGPYRSLLEWSDNIYGNTRYGTCGEYEDFNNVSSKYDVGSVSISEQFSPLLGVDASLKNSLSLKAEVRKGRNVQLDIPGNQILESSSMEFVVGAGYRFDDIGMIINFGKQQKKIKNDLNLRGDLSYKNTDAFIRIIDEEYSRMSSGMKSLSLKLSADYVLSERLNVKLYYDCKSSTPKVSEGFPIITSDFGIAFKINLTR